MNQDFADRNLTLFRTTSFLGALMPVMAASGTLIIIGYGSVLLERGDISIGTFAAFFSYLALVLWPVREAGSLVTQWQRGASGTDPALRDHGLRTGDRGPAVQRIPRAHRQDSAWRT